MIGRRSGVVFAALALAGCATLPAAQVRNLDDGGAEVRVDEPQSFRALAATVYGDPKLGEALAAAVGRDFDAGLAAGETLTVPSKPDLKRRMSADKKIAGLSASGERAARAGRWEESAEKYRKALELRPEDPEAQRGLGVALHETGRLSEARPLLDAAVRGRPDDVEARYRYGSLLRDLGERDAALVQLNRAVQLDGGHARAAYERALTLHDLERYDDAQAALENFLFAFPADVYVDVARRILEELREP